MGIGMRTVAERMLAPLRPTTIDQGHERPVEFNEASLSRYDEMLETEAHVAGVPADLLKAICWFASGWRQFDPTGRVLSTPTPQGTCYGCMQLNDVWHPDAFPAAMTDAAASVRYAAHLLIWLHEQLGDWDRATIAFFGHDRRAENAARRIRRYRSTRPWDQRRGVAVATNPAAPAVNG